jgi:hypothetical protein
MPLRLFLTLLEVLSIDVDRVFSRTVDPVEKHRRVLNYPRKASGDHFFDQMNLAQLILYGSNSESRKVKNGVPSSLRTSS